MKPVFLLDVDEVLADFSGPAALVISEVLGRPWTLAEAPGDDWDMFSVLSAEEYRAVSDIIDAPGWCSEIQPLPGAHELVERLRELCEVHIITGHRIYSRQWVFERSGWLERHFGFDPEGIVHTHSKHLVGGDFLLDDRPDFVTRWQERHPQGDAMLWSTPHNERLRGFDELRVYSRDEVIERVRRFEG